VRYQSDYILRLIEQLGEQLRRAVSQLRAGETENAYDLAHEAIGVALDIDPELATRMSPHSLASLLEMDNADDRVVDLIAQALEVEAEVLQGQGEIMKAALRREQASAVLGVRDPGRAN